MGESQEARGHLAWHTKQSNNRDLDSSKMENEGPHPGLSSCLHTHTRAPGNLHLHICMFTRILEFLILNSI